MKYVAVILLGATGLLAAQGRIARGAHPNIIVILADDLGWGDPGCYNPNSKISTPGIDRLATEGIRFTDAHTPSAVCTPTRYGLLTGRYCWRSRLKSSVLDGFSPPLIEADRTTIASYLKAQGYRTACIGKWHLGMQWIRKDGSPETLDRRKERGFRPGDNIDFSRRLTAGPLTAGFDEFFGISASLDMPPYCWIENDRCDPLPTARAPAAAETLFLNPAEGALDANFEIHDVLPTLKHRAVEWIRQQLSQNRNQPFFLYLPLNSPHLPVAPSKAFRGVSNAGLYGDFVAETDDCVNAVLDVLKQLNADKNTLLVFTSDNGGLWHSWDPQEADDRAHYKPTGRARYTLEFGHRSNAHLRGTKADIWEGGHRVPLVVRWPDRTPAGKTCRQLVELNDLLATVADIVGAPLPEGAGPDSQSILPLIDGTAIDQPTRQFALHHSLRGVFAIRQGNWKMIEQRGSGGFSSPSTVEPRPGEPVGQLYNLDSDPSETSNLWAEHPDVVARLSRLLQDVRGSE